MYAKQYEITLPADYDMQIIRRRVAAAAHLLDDRAGLGMKAFLIRERAAGSPVNQYAPFYLWNDAGAMARFLVGRGGFERIIGSFGRPRVLHWTGLAAFTGPARATTPAAASRRLTPLPAAPDRGPAPDDTGLGLAVGIEREIDEVAALAGHAGVHTAALAIDPYHWHLVRFVLWAAAEPGHEDAAERYEVLHLSAPGLAGLPDGRAW